MSVMTASPKVTVVIPAYNREKYIAAAIDSILRQSFPHFELLLLDDGSTDESVAIMRTYTDPRVRVVCNETNLGVPKTRNRGLELARGEYIAMLDSDDYAYPERLARQVAFLDRHQDYAVVGSWVSVMKEQRSPKKIGILPVSADDVRARLLFHCSLSQASIMARTAVLQDYKYREQYVVCEDFDLWMRLAKTYKLANVPEFLVCRRMHAGRITYEKAPMVRATKRQLFATQLAELGMKFSDSELDRHFLLLRMKSAQGTPDLSYLEWAEGWLRRLQEANQRSGCYPQPAFSQVLAEVWLAVCWQTAARIGFFVLRI